MGRIAAASASSADAADGVTEKTLYTLLSNPGRVPKLGILKAIARGMGVDARTFYEYPIASARETPEQAERRAVDAARKAAKRAGN